ncbi:MAG: thioredoxin family protein [Chitinophagaceae bacterium]|nr:thioredoxin family protein [Chitinophagaceae bacterium]
MKRLLVFFTAIVLLQQLKAQDMTKFNLYNPKEDAAAAIKEAVKTAGSQNKHVFIQVGGNWCIWCARFNNFITEDESLKNYIDSNFVVYHLNYSPENKNQEVLARYGFPQRFGFPVFLILNEKGELIHTENSAYLEEGKGYSKLKVIEFLKNWSKSALDPTLYKEQ